MKKRFLKVMAAILLTVLTVSMASCGSAVTYDKLRDEGYTVTVRFDAGGAFYAESTGDTVVVELYDPNNVITIAEGRTGIPILDPMDSRRGDRIIKFSNVDEEAGFDLSLVGWYTERAPRVDENGTPLDAYGVPTAESGREQGYVYGGRWDFEKDVIEPETLTDGTLTLYAAWVPYLTYEIYAVEEGETVLLESLENKLTLHLPVIYGENDIDLMDLSDRRGMNYVAAYFDAAMTEKITDESVDGERLFIDAEKGIAPSHVVKIYTVWKDAE